uniref:Uncharacterized protein n=1 Tax=Arundo donax TaxID=35708 RepID=A0A0A8YU73_ARUDO
MAPGVSQGSGPSTDNKLGIRLFGGLRSSSSAPPSTCGPAWAQVGVLGWCGPAKALNVRRRSTPAPICLTCAFPRKRQ